MSPNPTHTKRAKTSGSPPPARPDAWVEREEAARLTVSLPASVAARLRQQAQISGRPVSTVVREALVAAFDRQGAAPLPSFAGSGHSRRKTTSARTSAEARTSIVRGRRR